MSAPVHGNAGEPARAAGASQATWPPGSIWRAALSVRRKWSGSTSGWPGSRPCRRSARPATAGPASRPRFAPNGASEETRYAGLAGLAAAASIALAVGVAPLLTPAPSADNERIEQVMARSRALESALHRYDPESRVLDGRTAGIAQELEDRIAGVDRELELTELLEPRTKQPELLRLWRERVGLLDALVDVHVTRASNVGL